MRDSGWMSVREPPASTPTGVACVVPEVSSRGSRRMVPSLASIVVGVYLVLTLVFWGSFVLERGLPGETGFIELSQNRPGLEGFVYPFDSSRRWMSASFHLAYLISDGSYFTLHLIFGIYIFLTGGLTYAILRRLGMDRLLAFVAGAMALTHGADRGINWIGFIVQRQAIVLLLAAILLVMAAARAKRPSAVASLIVGSAAALYVSLWTYEAVLPLSLAVPLLLWRVAKGRGWMLWSAGWLILPLINGAVIARRYFLLGEQSYQSRLLSNAGVSLAGMMQNLTILIRDGLSFWMWPVRYAAAASGCEGEILWTMAPGLVLGLVVFAAAGVAVGRTQLSSTEPRRLVAAAVIAGTFLLLSYSVFPPVTSDAWRTQLFAAPPAAVLLAIVFRYLGSLVGRPLALTLPAAALVVASGLASGQLDQLNLRQHWAAYRHAMGAMVNVAPRIGDNSLVLLVDLPTRLSYSLCPIQDPFDPFADVMWFNSALQVLYPDTKLVGIYYRNDGSTSDSIRFTFDEYGAHFLRSGIGVEGREFAYNQIIAFRFDQVEGVVLAKEFSRELLPTTDVASSAIGTGYNPFGRILPGPAPSETRKKLGI